MNQQGKPKSQATKLVALANHRFTFFHSPEGEPFAKYKCPTGGRENLRMRSMAFRSRMSQVFYEQRRKTPGNKAIEDALSVLTGIALYDSPEEVTHLRIAEDQGCLYIDLGNHGLSSVKITNEGWTIIDNPPVNFLRPKGYKPLPNPTYNDAVDVTLEEALTPFTSINPDHWPLLIGWILGAYAPAGPYPVLSIHGEQGAAKTTLARVLKRLIDPNTAPVRSNPENVKDFMIAARSQRILAFDNVSFLKDWLSDAICRLSTGGGYATRALYTNAEEAILDAQCPVILNGIDQVISRGDLVDRSINIEALPIIDTSRKTESQFWKEFEKEEPGILAMLFDVLSVILSNRDNVKIKNLPRMADFAKWVTAAEPALGWNSGYFIQEYKIAREDTEGDLLDKDPLAQAVISLMTIQNIWKGPATTLQHVLSSYPDVSIKSARGLSNALTRLAPALRRNKIEFTKGSETENGVTSRFIKLERTR
jgi:hypothetical protein